MLADRIGQLFALRAALVVVLVQLEMPRVAAGQAGAHRHLTLRGGLLAPDGAVLAQRLLERCPSRVNLVSLVPVEAEPGRESAFVRTLAEVVGMVHATTSSTER